jgi:hypothetical protein
MKKLILMSILFMGCSNEPRNIGAGLPFDMEQNNIAALFTMTDESGRIENLKMMESVFKDKSLGFECQSHHNKSSQFIYDKLTDLAQEVGSHGTLLIYLNSHGGGSGSRFGMTSSDGFFKFSRALDAIAKSNKVRRLIVLIDTCHASGGIQEAFEGNEKQIQNVKTQLPELPAYYEEKEKRIQTSVGGMFRMLRVNQDIVKVDYGLTSGAYDEALIIASSSAEDLSNRGTFASRLKQAFEKTKNNKEITITEFLKTFASLHSNATQKPHYKVLPTEFMLNEPLFYNLPVRDIPIIDRENPDLKFDKDYIPLPLP